MDKQPEFPIQDDELHALLDGQLGGAERSRLQARLRLDPAASARFAAWQRQRTALRGLHAELLTESMPASLQAAAKQTQQAHQRTWQLWRWGGMAAGLVLAFGLGWLTHQQWPVATGSVLARQQPTRDFVRQAALAHLVYSPEVRHPVEVGASQEEHLVQWLSKRLGRPLKLPRLQALGYELVGGRLLPGDEGARAQFMYQNTAGERVTLYLGSRPARLAEAGGVEFRYNAEGPVPSFYWIDQGYAYALSGALTRPRLLLLAQAVHQQL